MAAPTDIKFSVVPATVNENAANGTVIGTFSAVDVDPTTYTWTLLDNAGGRFSLSGTSLIVANSQLLDYEIQNTYSVTVRVTEGSSTFSRVFSVELKDITGETMTGSAGADTLTSDIGADSFSGAAGNDSMSTGAGNDVLDGGTGADTMRGGTGNDTYVVDNALDVAIDETIYGGVDLVQSSVTYTIGATIENLTLTGTANIDATGNSTANILTGNAGNNVLTGLGGADTMIGGGGNDTYYVDATTDAVREAASAGTDTVISSVTYTLTVTGTTPARDVENLTLSGTTAINGTGNALANVITGNSGNNILDGKAGSDTLIGGLGNDTYYVDAATDVVTESSGTGGTDTVMSSVTYSIATAANVEKLTLTGTAAIDATGNGLANTLTGNSAANVLDGGVGNDTMTGGAGNDTYLLDSAGDKVVEATGGGTDTVRISSTFSLATVFNVERLELLGTAAINATGNTLANQLVGNSAANILDGDAGIDNMTGGLGNDTYVVDNAADVATEAASGGTDTVVAAVSYTIGAEIENLTLSGGGFINGKGNGAANTLTGNTAGNLLDGAGGADTMIGGMGDDTYVVDVAGDVVTELASAGNDTVMSAINYTLATTLEDLTLTGTTNLTGTGNGAANLLTGNSGTNLLSGLAGNDTIGGGAGNDTLTGGDGRDTFFFNVALNGTSNVDQITDFTRHTDHIELSRSVFTAFAVPGALAPAAFKIGTAATTANERIIYNSSTGDLFYDADGSGAGVAVRFAVLSKNLALTATDFTIV